MHQRSSSKSSNAPYKIDQLLSPKFLNDPPSRPRSGLPLIQPKLLLMVEMRLLCVTERKSEIVSKAEGLDDRYREVELATGYRAGSFARERCAEMEQHASLLAVGI